MIYVIQNLTGYGLWVHKESDTTERLTHTHTHTHTHTRDVPSNGKYYEKNHKTV